MRDYLYDIEGDHYSFLRVPKILLQHEEYYGISAEAKLLYSLLLDRTGISRRNGWKDDQDRIYIIFTIDEIRESLSCGNKKAIQLRAGSMPSCSLSAPQMTLVISAQIAESTGSVAYTSTVTSAAGASPLPAW